MPNDTKILTPLGIFRGNSDTKFQYYQMQAKDKDENMYILSFGCQLIHQESIEKSFNRLTLIPAPTEEEMKALVH